jgi:Zn-dependent peptidase ImmA (M78 family)
LNIHQSKLSKIESGLMRVGDDDLRRFTEELGYPPEFFFRTDPVMAIRTDGFHHRKRQSLSITDQRRIHAKLTIRRLEIDALLRDVEIDRVGGFEPLDPDQFEGNVERIAAMVRARWGVSNGPIPNLIELIERSGGMVIRCDFGTDKLDAVSHLCSPLPALFFVNSAIPADRERMTLAHEVAHIVMHTRPTPDVEGEADQFAAAFLMPSGDIHAELCPPLNYAKLRLLKMRWRVSMQSLIRRARDLGTTSDRTYRSMCVDIGRRGWRRREPDPIEPEAPTLLRDVLKLHREEHQYSVDDLSRKVGLLPDEFSRLYLPGSGHLRIVP